MFIRRKRYEAVLQVFFKKGHQVGYSLGLQHGQNQATITSPKQDLAELREMLKGGYLDRAREGTSLDRQLWVINVTKGSDLK